MKRLDEIYRSATKALDSPQSSASAERPTLDRRSLEYLWRWMAEQYGSKWTSQYGEKPCGSWGTTLAGLEPAQLRAGLDTLARSGAAWPPSAPEFRAMCRTGSDDGAEMAGQMSASRMLPETEEARAARLEAGKEGLAKAWAAIGKRRRERCERV